MRGWMFIGSCECALRYVCYALRGLCSALRVLCSTSAMLLYYWAVGWVDKRQGSG